MAEHHLPSDIERSSLGIIQTELKERGITLNPNEAAVICRVIHATADFDFAENLRFTEHAAQIAAEALQHGAEIVTDTNMAKAGVSKVGLSKLGGAVHCFMAEPEIAEIAKQNGTTRAMASMRYAAEHHPSAIFAVGNAPTALFELSAQMETGLRPTLVISVPVGFVNVVESKEQVFATCEKYGVSCIAAMGRKGGSSVAAAICNALIYSAAEMTDPAARGWN